MPAKRQALTLYHIRQQIDGVEVASADQILLAPETVEEVALTADVPFAARLFVSGSDPQPPKWAAFLEQGFRDLEVAESETPSAVLVITVQYYRDHLFAFCFGHGRHLMRPDCYDRNYGLRVALNVIYESEVGASEASRIRSVSSTTVAANTIRTQRQADRRTAFEVFGIDIQRDLLRAVTGIPIDSDAWGTRVSGADSLSLAPRLDFTSLGELCVSVARKHRARAYQTHFDWIDNLRVVTEPGLRESLLAELINQLLADVGDVSLSVPTTIAWDDISEFRFSFDPDHAFRDPDDGSVMDALMRRDLEDSLDVQHLKRWSIEALDGNGQVAEAWPLIQCLSAEINLSDDQVFILTEGDFFEIRPEYGNALFGFIDQLPEATYVMPPSIGDVTEGQYNQDAAEGNDSYLLLDKKTVRVGGITSPIEICDVYTSSRAFIHVKRKLGSSSLSHLFAQGYVSADLFLMNDQYRRDVRSVMEEAEQERAAATNDSRYLGRFSSFETDRVSPPEYEVVYAVVAKWDGRTLNQALPFFSKVNLRRHVEDLRRMGYRVSFARIDVHSDD